MSINPKYSIGLDDSGNIHMEFLEGRHEGFAVCITHIDSFEEEDGQGEMVSNIAIDYHVAELPDKIKTYDGQALKQDVQDALLSFLEELIQFTEERTLNTEDKQEDQP